MGLLDNNTIEYYQGNNHGNYQFTSLDDIINQFMVVYVGEGKIISKIKRTDVAFHAQRAMQELSFDTFKSCKAQEITLPASLQMTLPHDYVNYTKISWVDSAGVKHPLYPTSKTSNPFSIRQDDDGNYLFSGDLVINGDFSDPLELPWQDHNYGFESFPVALDPSTFCTTAMNGTAGGQAMMGQDTVSIVGGKLSFEHYLLVQHGIGSNKSRLNDKFQEINVTGIDQLTLTATGAAQDTTAASGTRSGIERGWLRVGLISVSPYSFTLLDYPPGAWTPIWYDDHPVEAFKEAKYDPGPPWLQTLNGGDAMLEWNGGESSTQSLNGVNSIDVSAYDEVWLVVLSAVEWTSSPADGLNSTNANPVGHPGYSIVAGTNTVDNIVLFNPVYGGANSGLQTATPGSSVTWSNYKSASPSENQDDYIDDTYWPKDGSRFGLDPQYAQTNGSYYIDCVSGKIHFSSNLNGKTIVLDYISDSLGTDGEMQVHKFAEEAMYKWISHAVLASRANTPEYLVARYKRERSTAIRQAKLRLSNIKLEEITQIFRGKSKQIKH